MAVPRQQVVQVDYQNPHAQNALFIPVWVVCNTPDEVLEENVRINSAKDLPWLEMQPETDKPAVMVGGGASAEDHLDDIRELQSAGGVIYAMNGASRWLRENGIEADYQCVLDAKEETSILVDPEAKAHLIGSQVHPKTMDAAPNPTVWHLELGEMELLFPPEKFKAGGYCLLGGGSSVGNSAMSVAYAKGHREFHVFGYDCSHRDNRSHAYEQDMNTFMPTMTMEWGGKSYKMSMSMRGQLSAFQVMARELKKNGCTLEVYGDGLLQHVYRTKYEDMTERDKYRAMWCFSEYRELAPGQDVVPVFLEECSPQKGDLIIDFGCGTGRPALDLHNEGHKVLLVDFADNCRDQEALFLPFLQHDLTEPLDISAPWGFCTDVLEHIPPDDVEAVVRNIMASAETTFFQINTAADSAGVLIGHTLHLSVHPHDWWVELFEAMGLEITWQANGIMASCFIVRTPSEG